MAVLAVRFFYFALQPTSTPQPFAFSARESLNSPTTRDVRLPTVYRETSGAFLDNYLHSSKKIWLMVPEASVMPSFIHVGDPSGVAADMDVRFGYIPLIALARGRLGLDEGHNGFSIESGASIEHVRV